MFIRKALDVGILRQSSGNDMRGSFKLSKRMKKALRLVREASKSEREEIAGEVSEDSFSDDSLDEEIEDAENSESSSSSDDDESNVTENSACA